jgi:hypothetical protein
MSSSAGNDMAPVSPANLGDIVDTLERGVATHIPVPATERPAEDLSESVPGSYEPPD